MIFTWKYSAPCVVWITDGDCLAISTVPECPVSRHCPFLIQFLSMRKQPLLFALLSILSIMTQEHVLFLVSLAYFRCWPYFLNCKHHSQHAMFIQLILITIHFACGYFSSLKLAYNAGYSWITKTEGLLWDTGNSGFKRD